ncbi:MAG TPA: enoyl-CoA hydratase-related protein [Planctomycetota bacterium]|nr:enoyl-CoA hydratase-related protein [Planctomycetota bacterium]
MPPTTLKFLKANGVARIVLARPEVRNAFDEATIAELTDAFRAAAADASLRAVVLSGDGPTFCAGADARWMKRAGELDEAASRADARKLAALFEAFDAVPCTTFVLARGAALGGGAGLAAAADVVIAEEGCRFGFTEVRLGIIPAVISSFAIRAIGPRAARRYFATGELFDAARAKELGLVSEVVPAGAADARIDAILAQLLAVGPQASREAKKLVGEVATRGYPEVLDFCAGRIAAIRRTAEAQEGLAAFLEKREPSWKDGA